MAPAGLPSRSYWRSTWKPSPSVYQARLLARSLTVREMERELARRVCGSARFGSWLMGISLAMWGNPSRRRNRTWEDPMRGLSRSAILALAALSLSRSGLSAQFGDPDRVIPGGG